MFRLAVGRRLHHAAAMLATAQPTAVDYLPVISTLVATAFTVVLYRRLRANPSARYLLWWTIGVAMFGVGTATEALTTLFGWHEPLFRAWYISGALLGGAPLAQGTVYLVMSRRKADRLTTWLLTYVAIASAFVLLTPVDTELAEAGRLTGAVMTWSWVRLFSPLVNTYALVFLVGGAIWSARKYSKRRDADRSRVWGNWLIAIGALLPGIGGSFTRLGHVEVLYVTELIGLSLIWAGYALMARRSVESIHEAQRRAALQVA